MNQLSNNDQLLRYMDIAKLLHLLHNEELYIPRADSFNDNDKYEGYYTKQIYDISKGIVIDVDGKSSNKGLYENTQVLRESTYISCWMKSNYESMAHWEIYGGNNSVAIITSVGLLMSQLRKPSANTDIRSLLECTIEPIDYIDHNIIDENLARELLRDSLNPLKKKNIAFKFEEEVRVIFSHMHQPFAKSDFNKKFGKGFGVNVKPEELITGILVSPKADYWFYALVRDLMQEYNLSESVKWSKLHLTPFEESYI